MKKWILIIFTINLSLGHAQEPKLPCIDRNGNMDLTCQCAKKKNCMPAMSKTEKLGIKKLNEKVPGGNVMKMTKIALPAYKELNNVFNGKFDPKKFPYKKLKEANAKLDRVNKKLTPITEKLYQKLGIKPYKTAERVKMREKILKKQLGKKNMELIESGKIGLNIAALVEGRPVMQNNSKTASKNIASTKDVPQKDAKEIEMSKIKSIMETGDEKNVKIDTKKRFTDEELIAAANKKFKYFTVRKKDEGSIFSFISEAYRKNLNNLDRNAMKSTTSDREMDFIETQKRQFIRNNNLSIIQNSY